MNTIKFMWLVVAIFMILSIWENKIFCQTPILSWEGGSDVISQLPNYYQYPPGSRYSSVSWLDGSGNVWILGGYGKDKNGVASWLNDFWKYNTSSGEWFWMGGSDIVSQSGKYGILLVGSSTNIPGARSNAITWASGDDLWLFGGFGFDSNGALGRLNDLWKYSIATEEWTWMGGEKIIDQTGIYGTYQIGNINNNPGSRSESISWIDSSGNLWLFGGEGFDINGTRNRLNDLWMFDPSTNEWTWFSGSDVVNEIGNYGIKGISSPTNMPGARDNSISWVDGNDNLWFFGGRGYDKDGAMDKLNDLWKFDPLTYEWTWIAGKNKVNQSGVYGDIQVRSISNSPGGREYSVSWNDGSGNLWLFGGLGYDKDGNMGRLNDLWKYTISSEDWTWMGGSDTVNQSSEYGIIQESNLMNTPGARNRSISWIDEMGIFWLFGGDGFDKVSVGQLNDLWKYESSTGEWTWVDGSDSRNQSSIYGVFQVSSVNNIPGSRWLSNSWYDNTGNLWLFGGNGLDINGLSAPLNDLWKYTISSEEWTWMGGSDTSIQPGVYGVFQIGNTANIPGSRYSSSTWVDESGSFWLFGGSGYDFAGDGGPLNDLWKYSPSTLEWTWMAGSNVINQAGLYGTKLIGSISNVPGARYGSASWIDSSDNLWLFGGLGFDKNGAFGNLNDLWRFNPSSEEWTWMGGSDLVDQAGIFGTYKVGNTSNIPGSRWLSSSWYDNIGNLWLLGGNGFDEDGTEGALNDLWKYNIISGEWTWMKGSKIIAQPGNYEIIYVSDINNIPGARFWSNSWMDSSGNLWLFGGRGYDKNGTLDRLNDFWKYDMSSEKWTWMGGSDVVNQSGNYGTINQGDILNVPGSRFSSITWKDGNGNMWLFGGTGYDKNGSSSILNDLWKISFTPPPPEFLTSSLVTQNDFTISWQSDFYDESYEVDVAIDIDFTNIVPGYEAIATNSSILNIFGLQPGVTYYFRVRALNSIGVSDNSEVQSQITVPANPIVTDASSIEQTSLRANWNTVIGATNYYIEVSEFSDFSSTLLPYNGSIPIDALNTNTLVDGLTPGHIYYYRITAENIAGKSNVSNTISQITIPADPTTLTSTDITSISFTINWSPVAGVDEYFVQVSDDNFTTLLTEYDGSTGFSVETLNISGLSSAMEYQFRIQSSNTAGISSYSNHAVQFTKTDDPIAVIATNIEQTIYNANWRAVTGAENYYIEVSETVDFSSHIGGYDGTVAITGSNTSTIVEGLSPGIVHHYRITSENAGGKSEASNVISQITIPANPVAVDPLSEDITTISFKAIWEPVTGVEEYELEISSDEFVTFLEGYSPKTIDLSTTQEIITGLAHETSYKFRIRAKNSAGASNNSNTISVITLAEANTFTLELATISYDNTQSTANQTLMISVSGGVTPYTVLMKYKGLGETAFIDEALIEITPGDYTFEIASSLLDEIGLEFEVVVTDAAGESESQAGQIFHFFDASNSPTIPFERFGGTDQTWNLFSVPYELDNKLVSSIFADYDPERYEFDWKIVRFRNATTDFVNFNTGQVKTGEGYFFNAKEKISVQVGSGQTNPQIPFSLGLVQGWNLVGNPYNVDISWSSVIASNGEGSNIELIYKFTGSGFSQGDVIQPFSGGFVWAETATSVDISPVDNRSLVRRKHRLITSRNMDENEWLVPVQIRSVSINYQQIAVGMHPEANEHKDIYDKMTLPRFFNYVDMYSTHEDYFYPWFAEDITYTSEKHTWNFTMESNMSNERVTFEWDQLMIKNNTSNIWLVDEKEGRVIDMKGKNQYIFSYNDVRNFTIHYTRDPSAKVLPSSIMLGDAYPNPAMNSTIIPVALPDTKTNYEIELNIYNMQGQKVQKLVQGQYGSGYYEFTWDIDQKSPAGIYLYRLSFEDGNIDPVQKRVIIQR